MEYVNEEKVNNIKQRRLTINLPNRYSTSFLFLIGATLGKFLNDSLFDFKTMNPDNNFGIFGFRPLLSDHLLIKNLLSYLSYILGGLLFLFIQKYRNRSKKLKKVNSKNIYYQKLIQGKKDIEPMKKLIGKIIKIALGLFICQQLR